MPNLSKIKEAQPQVPAAVAKRREDNSTQLKYDSESNSSNYIAWREAIKTEAMADFSSNDQYRIITEGKEPDTVEVFEIQKRLDALNDIKDEDDNRKANLRLARENGQAIPDEEADVLKAEVRFSCEEAIGKLQDKLREAKDKAKAVRVRMWAWIWDRLSKPSILRIQDTQAEELEDARSDFNSLELLAIIEQTHIYKSEDKDLNQNDAEAKWVNLKQNSLRITAYNRLVKDVLVHYKKSRLITQPDFDMDKFEEKPRQIKRYLDSLNANFEDFVKSEVHTAKCTSISVAITEVAAWARKEKLYDESHTRKRSHAYSVDSVVKLHEKKPAKSEQKVKPKPTESLGDHHKAMKANNAKFRGTRPLHSDATAKPTNELYCVPCFESSGEKRYHPIAECTIYRAMRNAFKAQGQSKRKPATNDKGRSKPVKWANRKGQANSATALELEDGEIDSLDGMAFMVEEAVEAVGIIDQLGLADIACTPTNEIFQYPQINFAMHKENGSDLDGFYHDTLMQPESASKDVEAAWFFGRRSLMIQPEHFNQFMEKCDNSNGEVQIDVFQGYTVEEVMEWLDDPDNNMPASADSRMEYLSNGADEPAYDVLRESEVGAWHVRWSMRRGMAYVKRAFKSRVADSMAKCNIVAQTATITHVACSTNDPVTATNKLCMVRNDLKASNWEQSLYMVPGGTEHIEAYTDTPRFRKWMEYWYIRNGAVAIGFFENVRVLCVPVRVIFGDFLTVCTLKFDYANEKLADKTWRSKLQNQKPDEVVQFSYESVDPLRDYFSRNQLRICSPSNYYYYSEEMKCRIDAVFGLEYRNRYEEYRRTRPTESDTEISSDDIPSSVDEEVESDGSEDGDSEGVSDEVRNRGDDPEGPDYHDSSDDDSDGDQNYDGRPSKRNRKDSASREIHVIANGSETGEAFMADSNDDHQDDYESEDIEMFAVLSADPSEHLRRAVNSAVGEEAHARMRRQAHQLHFDLTASQSVPVDTRVIAPWRCKTDECFNRWQELNDPENDNCAWCGRHRPNIHDTRRNRGQINRYSVDATSPARKPHRARGAQKASSHANASRHNLLRPPVALPVTLTVNTVARGSPSGRPSSSTAHQSSMAPSPSMSARVAADQARMASILDDRRREVDEHDCEPNPSKIKVSKPEYPVEINRATDPKPLPFSINRVYAAQTNLKDIALMLEETKSKLGPGHLQQFRKAVADLTVFLKALENTDQSKRASGKSSTSSTALMVVTSERRRKLILESLFDFDPAFDTACTDNIAPMEVLSYGFNARSVNPPKVFIGVGGSISCNMMCDFEFLVDVYLSKDMKRFLVSSNKLFLQGYEVAIDFNSVVATNSNFQLCFVKMARLYILRSVTPRGAALAAAPETPVVATQQMVARARAAVDLHEALNHMGYNGMQQLISRGIRNCKVTIADWRLAERLFGKCVGCLKGKSHEGPPVALPMMYDAGVPIGHSQFGDAFYMHGAGGRASPHFIFVDLHSGNIVVVHAKSKCLSEFRNAVVKCSAFYTSRTFSRVTRLFYDNEPAAHAFEAEFERSGGTMVFRAAGEKIHPAEKGIDTVKTICRVIVASAKVAFPRNQINYLLDEAVKSYRLRSTPGSGGVSLMELLEGVQLDFNRIRLKVGSYGVAQIPSHLRLDLQVTEEAILLSRPYFGDQAFIVQKCDNFEVVSRKKFTALPVVPQAIIDIYASLQSIKVEDLDYFARGGFDKDIDDSEADPLDTPYQVSRNVEEIAQQEMVKAEADAEAKQAAPTIVAVDTPVADDGQGPSEESESPNVKSPVKLRLASALETPVRSSPVKQEPVTSKVPANPKVSGKKSKAAEAKSNVNRIIREVQDAIKSGDVVLNAEAQAQAAEAYALADKVACDRAVVEFLFAVRGLEIPKKKPNMYFPKARSKYEEVADDAGYKELKQIIDRDIFHPTYWNTLSENMKGKIIGSFTFFKEKFKLDGTLEKLKARLVAGGNNIDLDAIGNVSSPTARLETIKLCHALAAQFGWNVSNMDVPGAYLNTQLAEDEWVPMRLGPEEVQVVLKIRPEWKQYVRKDGSMVVLLTGGLYGMPQAGKLWNKMIVGVLVELGYEASESDECLLIKFNEDGKRSIIVLYVDDLIHFYEADNFQVELKAVLCAKFGEIACTDGDIGKYVGMEYNYDRADKSVRLTMKLYVDKMLNEFNIQRGSDMPVSANFMEVDDSSPRVDSKKFASGVMSIFYLALRVRPDVLFPVVVLSTRISDARESDVKKLNKVFRYIFATRERGIVLRTRGTRAQFSCDASYGIYPNARSQSSLYMTIGGDVAPADGYGGPIITMSSAQKTVALSSFEAEYNCVRKYAPGFGDPVQAMADMGFDQSLPAIVFEDNHAVVQVATTDAKFSARSRHLNIRVCYVRELHAMGVIDIRHQGTDEMRADPLTKPFSARAEARKLQALCNDSV